VVARAAALFDVGLFDAMLRRGQDADLWLRLAHRGHRIAFQRRVLIERWERSHGSPAEEIEDLKRVMRVLRKAVETLSLSDAQVAIARDRLRWASDRYELLCAKRDLARGELNAARRHFTTIRHRSIKARMASIALAFSPRLAQTMYRGWTAALRLFGRIRRRFIRAPADRSQGARSAAATRPLA
jgi:hypothetical protein